MISKRVSRQLTRGTLKLPLKLACIFYKPTIDRATIKGTQLRIIKKYQKPFDEKWPEHREIEKVRKYHEINRYLGLRCYDGDELVDTYTYSSNNESTVNEDTCNESVAYFNPSEENENRSNEVGNISDSFPDIPS